ncbi:phosphoserine transaminase [Acanthamoeba castellanii str. Neff]|uniref:phosphoserine transaminase n=1 Tax=Acanthamoeba castellanii (strain ATCC 30010 / Neff) TaxID=1257118 RepID=L8GQN5_ACACF|nr:phosphoserine transaminase [Acanthamoeba castellanii str. Neff]ELR15305.1 phosphoserine transaminase [Acanthamoeba castellanii str. Neff]
MATKEERRRSRTYNFSAGPATLPTSVLEQAAQETLNWNGTGMSVMEMSHRGKDFISILHKAEKDLRQLLNVSDGYKVMFLQGGGMGMFASVPLNLLGDKTTADYLVTGNWSAKAAAEAKMYCDVNIVADATDSGFTTVPERSTWKTNPSAAYLHYCDNETVHGVEFPADYFAREANKVDVPVVVDMSSNFFSRPVDVSQYAVVYGGAQKNVGIAGLTIGIVRDDMLTVKDRKGGNNWKDFIPSVFDWKKMVENESCLNTPPVYAIYMAGLCFDWLLKIGGLDEIGRRNERKSEKLYAFLDQSKLYRAPVTNEFRSRMNVDFRVRAVGSDGGDDKTWDTALEAQLVKEAEARGLLNLKGYRTVGGMRASLYNALPEEAIDELTTFLSEFEDKHLH